MGANSLAEYLVPPIQNWHLLEGGGAYNLAQVGMMVPATVIGVPFGIATAIILNYGVYLLWENVELYIFRQFDEINES